MDENTKHIVASNLAAAYCTAKAVQQASERGAHFEPMIIWSPDTVISEYQQILEKLNKTEESESASQGEYVTGVPDLSIG